MNLKQFNSFKKFFDSIDIDSEYTEALVIKNHFLEKQARVLFFLPSFLLSRLAYWTPNSKVLRFFRLLMFPASLINNASSHIRFMNAPETPQMSLLKRAWIFLVHQFLAKRIWLSSNSKKMHAFKNKHKGKRCFIIGNGPSLNELNINLLQNEYTFAVNSIFLKKDMKFLPSFYVVEDVYVAEDRKDEINNYPAPVKFFGNYLKYCLKRTNASTIWTNVIFDYRDRTYLPSFSKNAASEMYVGGSVTYLCMQLAYYMGFSEVYLVGFDHGYTIPETVIKAGNKLTSTSDDPNHFSSDYFGKNYRWHDPRTDRMERAYASAKVQFSSHNRIIKNATIGGHLEVFDRVNFDELFEKR
jgi:hypothetical protein